ncbi:MAG: hypothetical protein RIK00_12085 [Algiphilus sp.]|uniref:hypothetical protein n=1 Tax=Algiphilus sp. TaxID=1872431 RepID=UPI001CA62E36|nr:hypothetical protein [Algiphilus sp.]MBY8966726.1 hypothetical protein [Algiphilus acroporae]MCI5061769.1 hypothetical protein [Algiphilus sp.]MCI5102323.1 hypothetical protein [Algiphilus sp.]
MTRSQQDVENLFASQGIAGRYRELAKHPAPSSAKAKTASAAEPAASSAPSNVGSAATTADTPPDAALRFTAPQHEAATPRRGLARLGLVMPAPGHTSQPVASRPLNELFTQLSQGAGSGIQKAATATGNARNAEEDQRDTLLRHLRLPALFAHLERGGHRR